MKTLFITLVVLAVFACFFAFGNVLRCSSSKLEACPGWCVVKQNSCLNVASVDCQPQACRAPAWDQYQELIIAWLKTLKS